MIETAATKRLLERVMEYGIQPGAAMNEKGAATGTVFLIEDEAAAREGLCDLVESAGFGTMCFASAEEFIAGWDDSPGCVVLNAQLPGMSGVELQEYLLRRGIRVPLIFMTSHGDVPMVRKVMKAGAVDFLTKPVEKEEMLTAIQQGFEWTAHCAENCASWMRFARG